LNVVFFLGDFQGCGFYRCGIPAKYLLKEGINATILDYFDEQIFNWADICVLQRQYASSLLDNVIKFKQRGKKFIYDLDDDLFNIPYWNPAAKLISKQEIINALRYLKTVDVITTSTLFLKEQLSQHTTKPIFVLPNSLDFEYVLQPVLNSLQISDKDFKPQTFKRTVIQKEKKQGFINIFWGGGFSHYNDLKIVLEPLRQICQEHENVIFYMMAFCLEDFWKKLPSKNLRLIPAQSLLKYLQVMKTLDLDIGLAPLAKNIFNDSKSNLKVIEYLSLGICPLASDYAPYHETLNLFNSKLLVSSEEEWYSKLKALILDQCLREQIKTVGPKFVFENFNITKNVSLWKDVFIHL